MIRARGVLFSVFAGLLVLALAPAAAAEHGAEPGASEDISHYANSPSAPVNSDLAFWQELAFAGDYNGFRIFDIGNPRKPKLLSDYRCRGPQNDVGVYGNGNRTLLFLSVDSRQLEAECSADEPTGTTGWEGVRIFDVSKPRDPQFIKGVATDCGSHTHTVVPDPDPKMKNKRVYIYVSSYPLTGHGTHDDPDQEHTTECMVPHAKISVIEVPLDSPEDAEVVSKPSTGEGTIGCHDIGVFMEIEKAAAACLTEGQIWDISDPVNPVIEERIHNPLVNIWHSGAFTWDGEVAIFGDEEGGAAITHGCGGTPPGAAWFYRVSDPTFPLGYFMQERAQAPGGELICTTHNYNPIPVTDKYLLTSAFYQAGTGIIDFSDVKNRDPSPIPMPVGEEIAYFDAANADGRGSADTWSSYWYKGYIYANDIERGFDVFRYTGDEIKGARSFHHLNPQTQERFLVGPRG